MEPVGKLLKEKRLEKGLILDDVADITKIRKKYLDALESGNYGEIPDKVYTKSFLKIYSEFLGMDRVYVLKRYLDEVSQEDTIIAPKRFDQKSFGDSNYPKEKTRNNRLFYIMIGVLAILLLVWGFNFIQGRKNNENTIDNKTTLTNIGEKENQELPVTPPVVELPKEIISNPKHSFDKLTLQLNATDRVWVSATMDRASIDQFTLSAGISKSIEATKNIKLNIGNAGGLKLNINGFDLANLGNSGETIDLEITLTPGSSIQAVKIRGGKIETQILTD